MIRYWRATSSGTNLHDVEVEALQLLLRDRLLAELPTQVLEQHLLVEELHLDEDLAEPVPALALTAQGLGELLLRSGRRR